MIHSGDPFIKPNLREFGETIFAEMSALATETGAINLGQGFPDTDGPIEISELAIQAIRNGQNQYPPGLGIPELRKANAVKECLEQPVGEERPGSVLRTISHAKLYLDQDSSSQL